MTPAAFTAAREALGLSVDGLAAVLRVDRGTIYRWESGARGVPGHVGGYIEAMLAVPALRRYLKIKPAKPEPGESIGVYRPVAPPRRSRVSKASD